MTHFNVSAHHPVTDAIHTVKVNSASEALATEDGMIASGYVGIEIESA